MSHVAQKKHGPEPRVLYLLNIWFFQLLLSVVDVCDTFVDIQQREVRVFSQRHETRVSIPKHGAHEVCISEALPHRREVRLSSQGHETRIFMPKREVRLSPKRCDTRVL